MQRGRRRRLHPLLLPARKPAGSPRCHSPLHEAATQAVRPRLRRPALFHFVYTAQLPRCAQQVDAAPQLCDDRRRAGLRPRRLATGAPPLGAPQQPLRGRRPRPGHLRMARRLAAAFRGLQRRHHRDNGHQLPLHPADPRCSKLHHSQQQEPHPQGPQYSQPWRIATRTPPLQVADRRGGKHSRHHRGRAQGRSPLWADGGAIPELVHLLGAGTRPGAPQDSLHRVGRSQVHGTPRNQGRDELSAPHRLGRRHGFRAHRQRAFAQVRTGVDGQTQGDGRARGEVALPYPRIAPRRAPLLAAGHAPLRRAYRGMQGAPRGDACLRDSRLRAHRQRIHRHAAARRRGGTPRKPRRTHQPDESLREDARRR